MTVQMPVTKLETSRLSYSSKAVGRYCTFGRILLLVSLSLLICGEANAQAENYTMKFSQGPIGSSGEEVSITALFDIEHGANPLAGWSLGICHDFALVQPIRATSGATCEVVKNGSPADFNQIHYYGGDAADSGGVIQGVIICFAICAPLPPGLDYEILKIDYALVGPSESTATIRYCDDAGIPNLPPVDLVVVPMTGPLSGAALTPNVEEATITITEEEKLIAFIRGDCNGDKTLSLADGLYGLQHIFTVGSALICEDACDTDDSGILEVTDMIHIFNFHFLDGPAPGAPYPTAGVDPTTDDNLDCSGDLSTS